MTTTPPQLRWGGAPRSGALPAMSPSGQVAAARALGLGRFGELEVAGLHRAVGPVVRHDHAGREGSRLDQLQPGGSSTRAEEAVCRGQPQRGAAGGVFVRAAGRLHDAVEAGEGGNDYPAHGGLLWVGFMSRGRTASPRADRPWQIFSARLLAPRPIRCGPRSSLSP